MPREWAFRRGRPSDVPFVLDAWMKTLGRSLRRAEKDSGYAEAQKLVIASLLEDAHIYMATGVDDDDLLIGFICAEAEPDRKRALLHFVYAAKPWRGMGVARSLLRYLLERELPSVAASPQQGGIVITDITRPWQYHYAKRKGWGLGMRRTYYHALAKEMAARKIRDVG